MRITPADQLPITAEEFQKELGTAELVLVCVEGEPNGVPVLHYHAYLKGKFAKTSLDRISARLGRATTTIFGNSVFSNKQANIGTMGYIIKQKNVVYNLGHSQHQIDEYYELSAQYRRDLEASRRSKNRAKESSVKKIFESLVITPDTTAEVVVSSVLSECVRLDLPFPSRSSLETQTLRALYQFKPSIVNAFYLRNLDMLHR